MSRRIVPIALGVGADAERELIGEYDEIELPPVQAFVRRHRRFCHLLRALPREDAGASTGCHSGNAFRPAHPRASDLF